MGPSHLSCSSGPAIRDHALDQCGEVFWRSHDSGKSKNSGPMRSDGIQKLFELWYLPPDFGGIKPTTLARTANTATGYILDFLYRKDDADKFLCQCEYLRPRRTAYLELATHEELHTHSPSGKLRLSRPCDTNISGKSMRAQCSIVDGRRVYREIWPEESSARASAANSMFRATSLSSLRPSRLGLTLEVSLICVKKAFLS